MTEQGQTIIESAPPQDVWTVMATDLVRGLAIYRARFGVSPNRVWLWRGYYWLEVSEDDRRRALAGRERAQ